MHCHLTSQWYLYKVHSHYKHSSQVAELLEDNIDYMCPVSCFHRCTHLEQHRVLVTSWVYGDFDLVLSLSGLQSRNVSDNVNSALCVLHICHNSLHKLSEYSHHIYMVTFKLHIVTAIMCSLCVKPRSLTRLRVGSSMITANEARLHFWLTSPARKTEKGGTYLWLIIDKLRAAKHFSLITGSKWSPYCTSGRTIDKMEHKTSLVSANLVSR